MSQSDVSRRSVAKGAAWATPALAVAAAAPATASSCDPSENVVDRTSNLTFTFNGSVIGPDSDGSVTYVNNGPDALAAGTVLTFDVVGSYNADDGEPTVAPVSLPSGTTFTMTGAPTSGYVLPTYKIVVRAVLGQDFNPGQTLAISLNATGFSGITSTGPDSNYSGGETGIVDGADDVTNSAQSVTQACQTLRQTITITTTE